MSKLHFHFLTGDMNWEKYGGSFISKKLTAQNPFDTDKTFAYWLVIEVSGNDDTPNGGYMVDVSAVSPDLVSASKLENAWKSFGESSKTFDEWQNELAERFNTQPSHAQRLKEEAKVEILLSYGIKGHIWDDEGDNLAKLLKAAHEQADGAVANNLEHLDEICNGIGFTGWDFIKGADLKEWFGQH